MSGPKAVRVISREERIARCKSIMAELDAQVSEWLRVGERLGIVSDEEKAGTKEKVSLLRELLASDQFDHVERQVLIVICYLQRDLEERIDKQAESKRREKTVRRRLGIVAAQTLEMLNASGQEVEPSVIVCLESAAAGSISDAAEVERSINDGVVALSGAETSKTLTDEQKAFADNLKGSEKVQDISAWVIANPEFDDDLAAKVDGYIANLEVSENATVAAPFAQRAHDIREISDRGRRRMLLDTLIIDLADEVINRKGKRKLFAKAISLKTIVENDREFLRHKSMGQISNLVARWDDIDAAKANHIVKTVSQFVETENKKRAAKHRRAAMLEAFSELGYEIREGLETAWVKDKRIVVRKSAHLDHGVELSGNAENGRLQVRAVRIARSGEQSDTQRDIDIETVWCSEFGKLRDILDEKGGELTIEKAKAVGEIPVKVVSAPEDERRRDRRVEAPKKRMRD